MSVEPPLKRRRKGDRAAEPWQDDWDDNDNDDADADADEYADDLAAADDDNDDDDIDELVLRSLGPEPKHDDGYRLSIERAFSDHRFQATMAHIFEKYGRDFHGIGDEIDLMTGEIVVNNGHIHNMRDEMDVGAGLLQHHDTEDDDDVLLGEFLQWNNELEAQHELDEQTLHEVSSKGSAPRQRGRGDDDGDAAMLSSSSPPSHLSTMALVSRRSEVGAPAPWGTPPPATMPGVPWTSPFGASSSGFGASSVTFSPALFTMGASPFHSPTPWGVPRPLAAPHWVSPQAPVPQPGFPGQRYNFKAQKGSSSIWAVRSRYKEAEDKPLQSWFSLALAKPSARPKFKVVKSLCPAPAASPPMRKKDARNDDHDEREGIQHEEGQERSILLRKAKTKRGRPRRQEAEERMTSASKRRKHHHDDESPSCSRRLSTGHGCSPEMMRIDPDEDSGTRRAADLASRRGRKRKRISTPEASSPASRTEESSKDARDPLCWPGPAGSLESAPVGRKTATKPRRSLRHSGRIEVLDRTPREAIHQEPRPRIFFIELPAVGMFSGDEYQMVDVVELSESEPDSPNRESHPSEPATEASRVEEILDQDVTDPMDDTSTAQHIFPGVPEDLARSNLASNGAIQEDEDPACVFSDDEAPIILPKLKMARAALRVEIPEKSTILYDDEDPFDHKLDLQEALGDEPEDKATDMSSLPITITDGEGGSETTEAIADSITTYIEPDDASSSLAERFDDDTSPGTPEMDSAPVRPGGFFSDAVPLSSSPSRGLARIAARISLTDQVRPLPDVAETPRGPMGKDPISPISPISPGPAPAPRWRGRLRTSTTVAGRPKRALDQQHNCETEPETEPEQEQPTPPTTATPEREPAAPEPRTQTAAQLPLPRHAAPAHAAKSPQTPRRRRRSKSKPLSSRHSILSLLPNESNEMDELGRSLAALPSLQTLGPTPGATSARRLWKSSVLTTEVYRTPVRKRLDEPASPGSLIQTPGGSVRICGVGGYRCGRDFCFTCL